MMIGLNYIGGVEELCVDFTEFLHCEVAGCKKKMLKNRPMDGRQKDNAAICFQLNSRTKWSGQIL